MCLFFRAARPPFIAESSCMYFFCGRPVDVLQLWVSLSAVDVFINCPPKLITPADEEKICIRNHFISIAIVGPSCLIDWLWRLFKWIAAYASIFPGQELHRSLFPSPFPWCQLPKLMNYLLHSDRESLYNLLERRMLQFRLQFDASHASSCFCPFAILRVPIWLSICSQVVPLSATCSTRWHYLFICTSKFNYPQLCAFSITGKVSTDKAKHTVVVKLSISHHQAQSSLCRVTIGNSPKLTTCLWGFL